MSRLRIRWALFGVTLFSAAPIGAQAAPSPIAATVALATLVGSVKDSAGKPVANVEVWLRGSDLFTHTNELGGFRLPSVAPGDAKVSVRRLGYEPALVDVKLKAGQIDSLVLSLTSSAAALPGVLVEGEADSRSKRMLAGFWERRNRGFGHFMTHDEIVKKDPHDFTDIVRSMPSVQIVERNGRRLIRFPRAPGTRGDCPPQYWVDGMRAEGATPDEFPAGDIEAVEVYSGPSTIPPQFAPKMSTYACGVIVIWTRLPGT
ncbi:MAG: TonB family protein [Gemmatimonadetes bacterium]|nr:TonB family protein [Gemmatimonadota bacterium]